MDASFAPGFVEYIIRKHKDTGKSTQSLGVLQDGMFRPREEVSMTSTPCAASWELVVGGITVQQVLEHADKPWDGAAQLHDRCIPR